MAAMNVHVFATSIPTAQRAHSQASALVRDARSANKWLDVSLPALVADKLSPTDVSGLDDFVHTALHFHPEREADTSILSAGQARSRHHPSPRQRSSLDAATPQVSSASVRPPSPFHSPSQAEWPSWPGNQLALLGGTPRLATANVSLNQIPLHSNTPSPNQFNMPPKSQSASEQHDDMSGSQQQVAQESEQSLDASRLYASRTNPSLPPLPPNQLQLYSSQHQYNGIQDSLHASQEPSTAQSNTANASAQRRSWLQSQGIAAGDMSDVLHSNPSLLPAPPNQQQLYAPPDHSSGGQSRGHSFSSMEQAQKRSWSQSQGFVTRDVSDAPRSNPSIPPNQQQLYAPPRHSGGSQSSLYGSPSLPVHQLLHNGISLQYPSFPQAQEQSLSQDSLYLPSDVPSLGHVQPPLKSDSPHVSQDSLYHSSQNQAPSQAPASIRPQDASRTDGSGSTPPGLTAVSASAIAHLLSRSPVRGQHGDAGQESPPGLAFHVEPSFDVNRSFSFDVEMDVDESYPANRYTSSSVDPNALRGVDEDVDRQGSGTPRQTQYETAHQQTAYETAPQAQMEDVESAHDAPSQRSQHPQDAVPASTPLPGSQQQHQPDEDSPPSVHWSQILGRTYRYPADPASSPLSGSLPTPTPSQPLPSQQAHSQPQLTAHALLALSVPRPTPGAAGSQVQHAVSPAPSAYLAPAEADARLHARVTYGEGYEWAMHRAYGRAEGEGVDPYAQDGEGAVAGMGQEEGVCASQWSSSTHRLLSQSSRGSQARGPRLSQESAPARASQVLGPSVQTEFGQVPQPPPETIGALQDEGQEQRPEALQPSTSHAPHPMPAHSQLHQAEAGPSRLAAELTALSNPAPAPSPPPAAGLEPIPLALKVAAWNAVLRAKPTRKPRGPPPFAFTPCPPPRDAPLPSPEGELERELELPSESMEGVQRGGSPAQVQVQLQQRVEVRVEEWQVRTQMPAVIPRSFRLPGPPSDTVVPDSQEERERRERERQAREKERKETRERLEADLMREWDALKDQRRARIELPETVGWVLSLPHERPVPTRATAVPLSVPSEYAPPQDQKDEIMGSLPTDPERFYEKGRSYKEYHDSQQCTQEQWPPSQVPEAQVGRREGAEMNIDGEEPEKERDIFTNPDPLRYPFPENSSVRDTNDLHDVEVQPAREGGKKHAIAPVPLPLVPYTRETAEAFLRNPHGRCAWVVPVRGNPGFGCSAASILRLPPEGISVTPWPILSPSTAGISNATARAPAEDVNEDWTETFGLEKLRAALHALPQLLASGPATTGSFQDAPGEIVWTVDTLRGFWEFVILLRKAARVGLVGLRFVQARGVLSSQLSNAPTGSFGSQDDEHVRATREALVQVDYLLLELDARYAMTVRYLLHVWRYECTMPADVVALRRIREGVTGSDGDRERKAGNEKGKQEIAQDVEMRDDTLEGRGTKRKRVDSLAEGPRPSPKSKGKTRASRGRDAEQNLGRAITPMSDRMHGAGEEQPNRETREERMKRKSHSTRRMFHGARLLLLDGRGRALLRC